MFSQIEMELDLLSIEIEKIIENCSIARQNEYNPNVFAEWGGRIIAATQCLEKLENTRIKINDHIVDILKNSTDGNYMAKLGVLEDENRVLRDKLYLLQQDLKKYDTIKKKPAIDSPPDCFKELTEEEIDDKITEAYNKDDDFEEYGFEDDYGEEE